MILNLERPPRVYLRAAIKARLSKVTRRKREKKKHVNIIVQKSGHIKSIQRKE